MKNENGSEMKNGEGSNLKSGDINNQKSLSEATRIRLAQKEARKNGLIRGVWITASLGLVTLIIVIVMNNSKFDTENKNKLAYIDSQKKAFTELLTTRDSTINEWVITFDQIEKDLDKVKEKENVITVKSAGKELTASKKEMILKDIEYINTLIDQNKKKIIQLSAQLKNSGNEIKGLQLKVEELEASMKLRENEIADLKGSLTQKDFQIGELNTKMTAQDLAITQKDEQIAKQTDQKNTAFFVSGTYKDLKAKGLLSKEKRFLGLGKNENFPGDYKDNLF